MGLIVQKYGGATLADPEKIKHELANMNYLVITGKNLKFYSFF